MDPSVVVGMIRVALPVVVEHSDLVAHPDERHAAVPQDRGVHHDDAGDGGVDEGRVLGLQGTFQSSEARQGAADATVPGLRVVLEDQAAGEGPGEIPGVEV